MVYGSKGSLHSTPPLPENARGVNQFGPIMFALKSEEKDRIRAQLPVMQAAGEEFSAERVRELLDPGFEPLPTREGDQPSTDFFINEILHWEECCRTGAEPISSGRDNIGTMKIIFGILESSPDGQDRRLGRPLTALGRTVSDIPASGRVQSVATVRPAMPRHHPPEQQAIRQTVLKQSDVCHIV